MGITQVHNPYETGEIERTPFSLIIAQDDGVDAAMRVALRDSVARRDGTLFRDHYGAVSCRVFYEGVHST